MPGAVSGDIVKGYYLIRSQKVTSKTSALTAMLVDRTLGVSGLIVLGSLVTLLKIETVLSNVGLQSIADYSWRTSSCRHYFFFPLFLFDQSKNLNFPNPLKNLE